LEQQLAVMNRWGGDAEEIRSLADLGNRLYDQILPEELKQLCWSLAERQVKTLLILSDEPYIPWELIKPYRLNPIPDLREEQPFWGETFALARWLRGPAMTERFSLRRVCAVVPGGVTAVGPKAQESRNLVPMPASTAPPEEAPLAGIPASLPGAQRELQALLDLMESRARVQVLPAKRREVLAAFEKGEFDLLHVASHGRFGGVSAADASSLLLEDGLFQAAELAPRLAAVLRQSAPLVFFNACQTGRSGYSLTRLGAWSAELIRLGCGGFVGTQWRVTDEVALEISQLFYGRLFAGVPIAEALRDARNLARSRHPHDCTWLAYSCFADPNACLAGVPGETTSRRNNPSDSG
jgi:CHAT domain-containing protein